SDGSREVEVYNGSYVSLLRNSHSYRVWSAEGPYPALMELTAGHPHAGHLSMSDMRIRLSHTIQGLDKGRRLNQTIVNTGAAAVKTKEAVGGVLTSAKGAITNLWSSFTTNNNMTASSEGEISDMTSSELTLEAVEATEAGNMVAVTNSEETDGLPSQTTESQIPQNCSEDNNEDRESFSILRSLGSIGGNNLDLYNLLGYRREETAEEAIEETKDHSSSNRAS
ncbi:unnamed protein product, partial [Meganyctiphanes norvegica]